MLSTFRILAELPPDSLGAYIISMAHTASDVLAVVLLQVLEHVYPSLSTLHSTLVSEGKGDLVIEGKHAFTLTLKVLKEIKLS